MPFNDLLQANGVRLTETSAYLAGQDPDYADNLRQGFRRLSQVQNDRDLLPIEQQRMIEIALFLYDSNPLAKRLIDLVNSFVTGDGFTFSAKHPKVLDVLTRFWEDPVNDWPLKQLERFKMLSLLGEVLWPVAVRRTDGRVRMGYVDPANIEEIIPDPYNPEIVRTAVIRQGYTVDGVTDLPTRYSLINVDERIDSPAYGKLNYYPEPYGAFYFAINKPPNATRGRSDLITIFDWLDMYDQLLFGSSERASYLTDFVWDVTMKGADEDTLRKWFRENSIPRGAAMRVHNENVTWQAISPNLNTFDIDMMARLIKQHILTALGIPPSWVSDPGDSNRCFCQETQYLTRNGWKKYEEILDGEEIGTYNRQTKTLEFQVPIARYQNYYEGKMVRIQRSHVDFLVTPNHRMLLSKKGHSNSFHDEEVFEAKDLLGKGIYKIPTKVNWHGVRQEYFTLPGCNKVKGDSHSKADRQLPIDPWLRFLGYWISEGSIYRGEGGHFRIDLCQKKPDKVNKIRDTLRLLPFHIFEYQSNGVVKWIIYDKSLFLWLEQHAGKGAQNKKVPQFIFDLPPDQIMVFLEALMLGDGSWERDRSRYSGQGPRGGYYFSTSRQLIEDLQLLFWQCGYHPVITTRERNLQRWNACYTLNITPARDRRLSTQRTSICQKELVDYKGMVSCFEVPNGFLVTRRSGVIGISGNSVGVTMAGPVLKSLSHRQRIAKAMLTKILQFVIDQAVLAGTLQLPPEDRRFEVLAPSLTPSDMSALTNTMLRLVQSVKLAEDQRWISHETAAKVFLKTLSELGIQIAVEDELTKIMDLIRQRLQQEAALQVELQQQQGGNQQMPETETSTSIQPPRVEVPRAPKMTGPRLPRSATGSELQSPEEQQANQLASQAVTGEMTTRKGNPAG